MDNAIGYGEERIILATHNVFTWVDPRSTLTDDYMPRAYEFSTESLHTESL
jgi:uncharacterized membrane-anchored protein